MAADGKLMDMLTRYVSAHQHPFNIFLHMVGIPTIMFGLMIPMTWVSADVGGVTLNLGHIFALGYFAFYMTLDKPFAIVFFVFTLLILWLAGKVGALPLATSGKIAAIAFFGGYAAQFIGHAVEKSMPVLVKHPIEANLSAPFFTVVEMFKLLGLRDELFNEVQARISQIRGAESSSV